jgi:hypothetical protein
MDRRIFLYSCILLLIYAIGVNPAPVFTQEEFIAELDGNQVVPSVDTTNARGMGEFRFSSSTGAVETLELYYSIKATNIMNITELHLHQGLNGENGPIVVDLTSKIDPNYNVTGIISSGNVTMEEDLLQGPLLGKEEYGLGILYDNMQQNRIYVDIHTAEHHDGEIRGDI